MNGMTPFICDMSALSSEQRSRYQELENFLRSALCAVRELPDGYEFGFSWEPATHDALTEITPLENACCPFFNVSIRLEREGGKLWWRLTGQEGVKAFIHAEFGRWFGESSI